METKKKVTQNLEKEEEETKHDSKLSKLFHKTGSRLLMSYEHSFRLYFRFFSPFSLKFNLIREMQNKLQFSCNHLGLLYESFLYFLLIC